MDRDFAAEQADREFSQYENDRLWSGNLEVNPMRREYEMTEADLEKLLDAGKPVRFMVIGSVPPSSPQENANAAWAELGSRMGFDSMTVEPTGKGDRFFTAIAVEPVEAT